jgi:hypothetical protein
MTKNIETYCYEEPTIITDTEGRYNGHNRIIITTPQIISEYWNFWYNKMVQKYGENSDLITEENCIQDWVCVHWAWKV